MESVLLVIMQKWGPTAVSLLLVFIVSFLIRKINSNSKAEEDRIADLQNDITKMRAGLHNDITKIRDDLTNAINGLGERVTYIEQNYVKSEFFFRELSGWKSEINRLSDQINSNFTMLIQNIMQLVSKG